jgi:hypothetical protein
MKYKLTNESIEFSGKTLYRIEALKHICPGVNVGTLGGYVESEHNLDQEGRSWIHDNAKAWGNGQVKDNAQLKGESMIFENGSLTQEANAIGNTTIRKSAVVGGNAILNKHSYAATNTIYISGLEWNVTLCDNNIVMGCYTSTLQQFLDLTVEQVTNMNLDFFDIAGNEDAEKIVSFFARNHEMIKHFINEKLRVVL